jgi:hypothetical protein
VVALRSECALKIQNCKLIVRLPLQSNFFAEYMCFDLEGDADRTRSDSLNIDLSDEETEDVAPAKANDSKAGELRSWSMERITLGNEIVILIPTPYLVVHRRSAQATRPE